MTSHDMVYEKLCISLFIFSIVLIEQHCNMNTLEIEALRSEISDLNGKLQNAPNSRELLQLQEYNNTLKQDLQDLKAMHNNYMLQMQSLINQRAIEAPNPKRPWWKLW